MVKIPLIFLLLLLLLIIPVSAGCNPCDLYNKGENYEKSKNYDAAISAFQDGLDIANNENYLDSNFYQMSWFKIGWIFDKLQNYESAIHAYQNAMQYTGTFTVVNN